MKKVKEDLNLDKIITETSTIETGTKLKNRLYKRTIYIVITEGQPIYKWAVLVYKTPTKECLNKIYVGSVFHCKKDFIRFLIDNNFYIK